MRRRGSFRGYLRGRVASIRARPEPTWHEKKRAYLTGEEVHRAQMAEYYRHQDELAMRIGRAALEVMANGR